MEKGAREKAMWLLRAAADILEKEAEEMILPGWDVENEGLEVLGGAEHAARCAGIRTAAKAVAAEGIDPDHCTRVPLAALGLLVRYVGDMLEE